MKSVAGAATLGNLASAIAARAEEASVVAELKAGSEDAYAWLIAHFHQPIYSLVYRSLNDPGDAADVTQEVFLKVFRGMRHFNGAASLKTWIYRIAIHEASNQRRWWFRHKNRERSLEPVTPDESHGLEETLVDDAPSPFEASSHREVRERVEMELKQVPEPYRTTVILRDIEEFSYEEIADILQVSLGTVKSRLMRGREALKKRLASYVEQTRTDLGGRAAAAPSTATVKKVEVAS